MRVALLAATLLFASCDWSLHRMQQQPRCTVHGTAAFAPGGRCDLQPPEGIVAVDPPATAPPATRALLVRGRDRYQRFCSACHGLEADGISYVARAMTLRKPPSRVDAAAAKLDDDRILTVMAVGYGLMPSYAYVPLTDRFAIFHYMRALQQREVNFDALPAPLQQESKRWLP